MKKGIRFIGLGLAAMVLGLSAVAAVSAQNTDSGQPPFMGRGGPGGRGGPMGLAIPLGRLNLSDAQKEQVKAVMDSHQAETKALAGRALTARRALEQAVTADTLDEGLIRARAAELAGVESDVAVSRARIHGEVLQILTPEQRTTLRNAQAERQQRGDSRRQPPR
jgi:periplasmic protein CpxP/Spy